MEFLKNNRLFDFVYGGKPFAELTYQTQQTEDGDTLTTVYTLPDGLKITNIAQKHGDAYEWVNWWENTADTPSEIISELWDAAIELPMPHEEKPVNLIMPVFEDTTTIYAPFGSTCVSNEFSATPDHIVRFAYEGHILPGVSKMYATSRGRSSEERAPFFNVHKDGKGYIFAIGWTGQWNSYFARTEETIIAKAKIEDTHFRLLPGEKIRTASFVVMPYEGAVCDGQNKWRRLVKKYYCPIGQKGREEEGPICLGIWGGLKSSDMLEKIRIVHENALPIDYVWVDAGWFGEDPHGVEWWGNTGDWTVNHYIHPQGLTLISDATHKAGMKYLFWVEPERAGEHTKIVKEHPEYFFPKGEDTDCYLLNLGDEAAWQYCYNLLINLIDELGVDCYRQDFNWDPLADWRRNDAEDRQGISEIKHIMGLYRLWDTLLEKFPHLLIDNCASGGRRIDVETLRRSIPLWRSDYQCVGNFPAEGTQNQNFGFSTWIPYSGTGTGEEFNTYRFRSAYAPCLQVSDSKSFGEDQQTVDRLKNILEEYRKVRPYMSEDFYPLTKISENNDIWCASQYNRPEQCDGVLQVFRRERSPYPMAEFALFGLDTEADYVFTDADTGAETLVNGQTLMTQGFCVTIPEKRASKLYFYKKK